MDTSDLVLEIENDLVIELSKEIEELREVLEKFKEMMNDEKYDYDLGTMVDEYEKIVQDALNKRTLSDGYC